MFICMEICMKIIFIERKTFGNEDMLEAYRDLGYQVICHTILNTVERQDSVIEENFLYVLEEHRPDYVFSFNYEPLISQVCNRAKVPYLSWTYDSPYVKLYSFTAINPCNHIFIFDKEEYLKFHKSGITTVHYLPMAANIKRLDRMNDLPAFYQTSYVPKGDITFIGALYNEQDNHLFYDRMKNLPDFTRGYLEAIMAMQMKIQGYNFIEELLTPAVIQDMQTALPLTPSRDGVESLTYLYANYVINRKITELERLQLLHEITGQYALDLYTRDPDFSMTGIINHGPVDYYDFAPYVYRLSKINLNITLRSIKSGIPLRCFDIMGAGGFLLSNFQSDFMEDFIPGEDFAAYGSPEELLSLIAYYLEHENERKTIARNGHDKIKESHTYLHRIKTMENYLS